jgi:GT2 family glycosyltransferase
MTELVIKAIHKNTKRDNFRLVVLDNASSEATVEMLQKFHDNGLIDEFIPLKTNLGLEASRNLLLKEATYGKYFVCVDNDCLPEPMKDGYDWLERLVRLMEDNPEYAAISLRTQVMIGSGDPFDGFDGELLDFPHPGGSFRIMRTGDVLAVKGWDRDMKGRGQEERYICGKLREAGWKTGFAANIHCLHLFGTPDTDRWGYPIDFKPEDTGHSDISHPALEQGDNYEEVKKYVGKDADGYFAR